MNTACGYRADMVAPDRRRPWMSPDDQGVTFIELFFDLVFVFAITELTGYLHHHLDASGVGKSILVFWLVWWAWTQFTWSLNPADTTHPKVRAVTLLATGIAFGMAASVQDAFTDHGGVWFGLPYVAVRLIGLGVYLGVGREDPLLRKAVHLFGSLSLIGLALVVVGSFAGPSARVWWWLGAVVADFVAAGVGGSGPKAVRWQIKPARRDQRTIRPRRGRDR
jgi:low temperature requirement protein LtrA